MSYRPAGYLEDEDDGEEAEFYFGDEEDLETFQPKFEMAVTLTSQPESQRGEVGEKRGKGMSPVRSDEPSLASSKRSVRICTCPDTSASSFTDTGDSLASKSSAGSQTQSEAGDGESQASDCYMEGLSTEEKEDLVVKGTRVSSDSGVCSTKGDTVRSSVPSTSGELDYCRRSTSEEVKTMKYSNASTIENDGEIFKSRVIVSEESKFIKSSTGSERTEMTKTCLTQTREEITDAPKTRLEETNSLEGVKDKMSYRSLGLKADIKVAISRGNEAAVLQILNNGLHVDEPLNTGWPPLLHACETLRSGIVRLFLDHGANPNAAKDNLSALMVVCMRRPTLPDQNSEQCVDLLLTGGALVNTKDRYGMTPLLYACQSGQYLVARKLVAAGADVNAKETRGWTFKLDSWGVSDVNGTLSSGTQCHALHFAASVGHTSLARLLIDSGADPTMLCNQGDSPLGVAYSKGCTSVADYLETVDLSKSRGDMSFIPRQNQRKREGGGSGADSMSSRPRVSFPSSIDSVDTDSAPTVGGIATPPGTVGGGAPLTSDRTGGLVTSIKRGGAVGLSSSVGVAGDLELFLMGLHLSELIPNFHHHKVEFSQLLSMTDHDLQLIGVDKVGSRKKILGAILEMHKNEWHMPENKLPYSRLICSGELCVLLSQLSNHTKYLRNSAQFILTHLQLNPEVVGPHMESNELSTLTEALGDAELASLELLSEVNHIRNAIAQKVPLDQSKGKRRDSSSSYRSTSAKVMIGMGFLAGMGACSWACIRHLGMTPSLSLPALPLVR